jgi:hypothetical protein
MSHHRFDRVLTAFVAVLTFTFAPLAWSQHIEGRINVTVVDQQGAVVPKADVSLVDLSTNTTRQAITTESGTYSFVNLAIGNYKLTVSKSGFAPKILDNVVVQATTTTDLSVQLGIGEQQQQVLVEAAAPVVETSTNAIGSVIDPKEVEDLPITGRDLTQLSRLSAGYNGTWNGLPTSAQGNNIDGVVGSPSRMKFGGNSSSLVSPRLENIEEMTVQTDQLDMNQGFGQGAMQINFVTRRGTNAWHGRAYEDFQNDWLNANSWSNNARGIKRPPLKLNNFGGAVGGPVFKDKLFFFASLSTLRQPGSSTAGATVLTPSAQAGNFTYVGTDKATHTVNVFQVAQAFNASLPGSTNSVIAGQQTSINSSLAAGTVTPTTDPNINNLNWLYSNPTTNWYPTLRVDYNTTQNIRMNLAINRTMGSQPASSQPFFPGQSFAPTEAGNKSDYATVSYGLDWTITPRLINQFKGGWLYNATFYAFNSNHAYFQNPTIINYPLTSTPQTYNLPVNTYYPVFTASDTANWQHGSHNVAFGFSFIREQDHYWNPPEGIASIGLGLVQGDPALDALTDTSTYNPLPAANTTQQGEAQNLYAQLTGRINNLLGRWTWSASQQQYLHQVTAYNLDELAKAWGVFAQDSWRLRPSLTLNFGLRWDFTGDDHDLTGGYHNSDLSSIYGPTAPGDLFQPGKLNGNFNPTIQQRDHVYNSWNVSPQPAIGFAYSPNFEHGILGSITGKNATVLRGGFSMRRFTVPYQYFWDEASDYGSFFYQFFTLNPGNPSVLGNFTPGSLSLGQTLPAYALTPPTYQNSVNMSTLTFVGSQNVGNGLANGMKFNLAQPYTESWTFGIQRQLGASRAIEIRYNGNRSLKQWITVNVNEVNVFENGFLQEFKNAQSNMSICAANAAACTAAQATAGVSSANQTTANFANWGLPGQVALPIMTGAFTGSRTGAQTSSQFRSGTFVTDLSQTGAVGDFARRLGAIGGTVPYFCNLVGAGFGPCANNLNYTGAGAGYPINFFMANPFSDQSTTAGAANLMTDAGYASYNALQVDFRQQSWHGMQFDANYTWSKSLGILPGNSGNDWQGNYTAFTLRDIRASYLPTSFDIHHVVHAYATADLPFGRGKRWGNGSGLLDRIVGGWNLGTTTTIQSGVPYRLTGGFLTYNNIADSGVVLAGLTQSQLQSAIGVHKFPGQNFVTVIDPKYLNLTTSASGVMSDNGAICNTGVTSSGSACSVGIFGNTAPGTFNAPMFVHGPHGFFQDAMITKNIAITERVRFNLQSEFLNVWNHPVFGLSGNALGSVRGTSFGTVTSATSSPTTNLGARRVELRANVIF